MIPQRIGHNAVMLVLQVEGAVLAALTAVTSRSAEDLDAADEALREYLEQALDGAGEFVAELVEGLLTFQLSWSAAVRTFASSCRAVGDLATQTDQTMAAEDAGLASAAQSGPR